MTARVKAMLFFNGKSKLSSVVERLGEIMVMNGLAFI